MGSITPYLSYPRQIQESPLTDTFKKKKNLFIVNKIDIFNWINKLEKSFSMNETFTFSKDVNEDFTFSYSKIK